MGRLMMALTVLCLGASTAARAEMAPPEWRWAPGSTYQEWHFDAEASPATPEVLYNPFGSPTATLAPDMYSSGWWDTGLVFGVRQGFWDLGSGTMMLQLPPGYYSEIWVETVYYRDLSLPPAVTVQGALLAGPAEVVELEAGYSAPAAWYAERTKWVFPTRATARTVCITGNRTWGSVVDAVVVDTRSERPIPGDTNLDCAVNILDLVGVRNHLSQAASSGDNWRYDLNADGAINVLDLIYVRNRLGEKCRQ